MARVVEGSRWNLDLIKKIVGVPRARKVKPDNSLSADDIEKSESLHDFDPRQNPSTVKTS